MSDQHLLLVDDNDNDNDDGAGNVSSAVVRAVCLAAAGGFLTQQLLWFIQNSWRIPLGLNIFYTLVNLSLLAAIVGVCVLLSRLPRWTPATGKLTVPWGELSLRSKYHMCVGLVHLLLYTVETMWLYAKYDDVVTDSVMRDNGLFKFNLLVVTTLWSMIAYLQLLWMLWRLDDIDTRRAPDVLVVSLVGAAANLLQHAAQEYTRSSSSSRSYDAVSLINTAQLVIGTKYLTFAIDKLYSKLKHPLHRHHQARLIPIHQQGAL